MGMTSEGITLGINANDAIGNYKMKIIYKYEIELCGETYIKLPNGYKILSFQKQFNEMFIWVEIDTDNISNCLSTKFILIGTGYNIPTDAHEYIGTVVMPTMLVWHLYRSLF